jgi:insulin-like growth factor-binding protein complex acid labile subunit
MSRENKKSPWPELTELSIQSNKIDSLSLIPFNLFPKLQKCVFRETEIRRLPEDSLRQVANLVVLDLLEDRATIRLSQDSFCSSQKLCMLRLGRVITDSFEVFDCLIDLEELEVEIDCRLMKKRVEKFARLPKLKELKLKLYDCEWIAPDAFDHLTSINSIELDFDCQLFKTFETGLAACSLRFDHDHKTLKLNSKNVSRIEKIQFDFLLLSGSNIESDLPLTGLKTLKISPANELSFLQMTNLEHLHLELNRNISFLDNGRLACLHSLKTLELHGLSIHTSFACLNGELFSGLTSLEKLSIKHSITFDLIEPGAFKHLTNLIELDLDNNSVETIELGAFAYLSKLKVLSMSHNKLTQFPYHCFHELLNLEELILDNTG